MLVMGSIKTEMFESNGLLQQPTTEMHLFNLCDLQYRREESAARFYHHYRSLVIASLKKMGDIIVWQAVLRIHDIILMWIRIRGSMPLTYGSGCGSGSCCFRH